MGDMLADGVGRRQGDNAGALVPTSGRRRRLASVP
jgi:hypothetical protein